MPPPAGSSTPLSTLPVIWSQDCLGHDPGAEIWLGVRTVGTETPERATIIRQSAVLAGAVLTPARAYDDTILDRVHGRALINHLRDGYQQWVDAGFAADPGQDRVVPYMFPTHGLLAGQTGRSPAAVHARAGLFCYDTMTLIGPGTWAAARGAVDAALTAADEVTTGRSRVAYALCRPPGHHAGRDAFGGSCYLNNAAVAVEALAVAGHQRIAVVDLDAHHGNGTQSLFYDRGDVLYGSVHVDPGAGWFPHYLGFADEIGTGDGLGTNHNEPLPPGAGDDQWLGSVARLAAAARAHQASAVVVSLGVDAAADDPESPLQVTGGGYRQAGELLSSLQLPTVVVQEGGYHLPSLGELVIGALTGLVARSAW